MTDGRTGTTVNAAPREGRITNDCEAIVLTLK